MASKEIIIDIDEKGDCSLDGVGFSGPECEKAMSEIESALGQVTSKTRKPEYTNIERTTTRTRERA